LDPGGPPSERRRAAPTQENELEIMNWLKRRLNFGLLSLALCSAVLAQDFARPIWSSWRSRTRAEKPLSTFYARDVPGIAGTSAWTDPQGKRWSADEAVLAMWLEPQPWLKRRVIAVGNKPLKEAVGLDQNEKRFSYRRIVRQCRLQKLFAEAPAIAGD